MYKKIIEGNLALVDNIESAINYKISGRADIARMFIAKVRYEAAQITYTTHLIARDIAVWY